MDLRFWRKSSGSKSPSERASTAPSISSPRPQVGLHIFSTCKEATVDIIFIHGLGGHWYETWKAEESHAPWPEVWLPARVNHARIMSYGYDSRVVHWRQLVSQNSVGGHADNLLRDLSNFRDEDESNTRPLLFVVHSLGGIVIQDALVRSRLSPDSHIQQILHSTKGIVFLGTPQSGTEALATCAHGVARILGLIKQTNPEILSALCADSEILYRIQTAFHTLIRDRKSKHEDDINITCFYEELPLLGFDVIVSKRSATLPSYQSTGLYHNHRDMTKFKGGTSSGFLAVSADLVRWSKPFRVQAAPQAAEKLSATTEHAQPISFGPTPILPHFPYSRNSDFVGCTEALQVIKKRILHGENVALNGIGGVGKTELAIEYCYRHYEEHPGALIFWIPCDSNIKMDIAFREIAQRLTLPGYDDANTDQVELVTRHMSGGQCKPWLMILDNADDIELMTDGPRALARLLPKFRNGNILLTTRDRSVALAVVGHGRSSITIKSLSPKDARLLLRSKLPDSMKIDEKIELDVLDILEYLPLCITQAAAYIDQSEIDLHQYWLELTESEESLLEILNENHIDLRRGFDVSNSVFRTWKLSFEKICKRHRQAGELLSVMAFIDRLNIPRHLLQDMIATRHELNSALGTLQGYCLIKADPVNDSFRIHRLVHLATRFWLRNSKEQHEVKALQLLTKCFPDPESEDFDTQKQLFPHAKVVESSVFHDDTNNTLLAALQYKLAAYEWHSGQYDLAERTCLAAYGRHSSLLGALHAETLRTQGLLGIIKRYQGAMNEAFLIQEEVLRRKEAVLGEKHLDTIATLNDLADVMARQGCYNEAEDMAQRVFDTRVESLGKFHPKTLQSLMNVATYKRRRAKFGEAEALGRRVLENYESTLGWNHISTLRSGYALAGTLRESGQYTEAVTISVRVLEGRHQTLGSNHPETLLAKNNLALGLRLKGDLETAEKLYREVCSANAKLQRENHPDNLGAHQCLGQVLRDLGRYDEAETVGRDTLSRREAVLGKEHLSTMNTAGDLAVTLDLKGNYEEAEVLAGKVLEVRTKVLGEIHILTLETLFTLASIKEHTGRVDDAKVDFVKIRDERTKTLGLDHPATYEATQRLQQLSKKTGS